MFDFSRLFRGRRIDAWCDEHIAIAAGLLNQVAADLMVAVEDDLKSATWKDGLIAPSSFLARAVAPKLREVGEPVVQRFLADANEALRRIVEHEAVWHRSPEVSIGPPGSLEGWQDVALAIGPLAGGATAVAAMPFAAVTTTTAWFGLATTTAISWPVVVGGGALAGAAIATGVLNTSRLWDKTLVRLRGKARKYIARALIEGTPDEPSVLDQVTSVLRAAAIQAKEMK